MRRLVRSRNSVPYTGTGETGANVPCLKHFFPCTETSGTTITDTKGGCVWAPDNLVFNSTLNTVKNNSTGSEAASSLSSGAFYAFEETEIITFMYAARIERVLDGVTASGCRFSIGDINIASTGIGFGLSDGPFHTAIGHNSTPQVRLAMPTNRSVSTATPTTAGTGYTVGDPVVFTDSTGTGATGTVATINGSGGVLTITIVAGGNWYTSNGSIDFSGGTGAGAIGSWAANSAEWNTIAGVYDGQDVVAICNYVPNPAGSVSLKLYDAATSALLITASSLTNNDTVGAFQPNSYMRSSGLQLYGAAIFSTLDSMPTNMDRYCLWMGKRWVDNDRSIHPLLIGIS